MSYSIWIVSPPGYPHSRLFEPVAESLQAAFAELGSPTPIVTDPAGATGTVIVLGPHLLPAYGGDLPRDMILFNMEQIQTDSAALSEGYVQLLRRHRVWDYSQQNIARARSLGITDRAVYCGLGYMPVLTRAPELEEDIDIVFIGSLNERRSNILSQLSQRGRRVEVGTNIYGEERDALIARGKVHLNLHFYAAHVFEIVRVCYLLANRRCVVSESGSDEALEAPFRQGVAFAPYFLLVSKCLALLEDREARVTLARRGFDCFSRQSQVPLLRQALAASGR